ncbi:DUF3750 domain-containing protein [Ancylobacter sonchi]|uniref:DUF3750 domain-containing protein n=1 Tax=Ancylobacter sonchi TaxID=1937790 RepID=UPI001BD44EE0|nr:DUF3750 domain-containing protein [Ancylobacter sonchi]MBS7536298.1 DUF3750 domain-containing protein [Ancylobacter sonchi]
MLRATRLVRLGLLFFFALPLAAHALVTWQTSDLSMNWRSADWSSTGTLPAATQVPEAMVRIYCAPVGGWRSIFAVHCWVVYKEAGASAYERYDVMGYSGAPIRHNRFPPDGKWYGNTPELVAEATGADAAEMIPKVKAAIAGYPYADAGDYVIWPGPNSNTFIAHVVRQVPELEAALPSTAIGKDYPVDGNWLDWTPSRTGVTLSLDGYAGLTLAWVEGVEINVLGAVAGLDLRQPGIKLPGFGRIGL